MKSDNLKVSIVTVVYNGRDFIEETIKSVINQTYTNIEYIIIDGGSTDGTLEIISRYKEYISKFVSEPDKGIYNAMNKGLKMCTGELIGIINSDDFYNEDTIESVVKLYLEEVGKGNKNFIITGRGEKINRKSEKLFSIGSGMTQDTLRKEIYLRMPIIHPATFVPNYIYSELGLFDEDYKILADYDLIFRFYFSKIEIKILHKSLVNMRIGGVSYGLNNLFLRANERMKIRSKYTDIGAVYNILLSTRWLITNIAKTIVLKIYPSSIKLKN